MSKASVKKRESLSSRVGSSLGHATSKEALSLATSASESSGEHSRGRVPFWPEWNEAEVNAEKWDSSKGKDTRSGKSSYTHFFEDPEGRVEMPTSLKVHSWMRPSEFIVDKTPVVVENETTINLTSANEHLLCSELMRWLISEIYILWKVCSAGKEKVVSTETNPDVWKPWEHIYSLCKVGRGHQPLYNTFGKYVVKLYWMGCWRKVTIDDTLPFDEENKLLLPATPNISELWPMLLAKALIKIANTDVIPGHRKEIGDFSVIHSLTGWVPEIIPLEPQSRNRLWDYLRENIPVYQQPLEENLAVENTTNAECPTGESPVINKGFQMVVCAGYHPLQLEGRGTTFLGSMADSSEHLRQNSLCQLYSHPVLLTRVRVGPLLAPPPIPPVPRWKLIRPRRGHTVIDESKEPPVEEPEQFVEVSSPFINFCLKTLNPQIHRKQTCNSPLDSFSEMEGTNNDLIPKFQSQQHTDPPEVTAEDREKDTSSADEYSQVVKEINPPVSDDEKTFLQETWVPINHFNQCFQTLLIFHQPSIYTQHSQKAQQKSAEDSESFFLFVDSLLPSEILLSFSALVHLGESSEQKKEASLCSGILTVQPFIWKSLRSQLPMLSIQTSACNAAKLQLLPGRHVVSIQMRAVFGFHLHLYSNTAFIFGDEDTVMSQLSKESVRFVAQAMSIVKLLGQAISCFSDEHELPSATRALTDAHFPPETQHIAAREHFKVFFDAVCVMFCAALGRQLTPEELSSVQALTVNSLLHTQTQTPQPGPEEELCVPVLLQDNEKDFLASELLNAARAGSEESLDAAKMLQNIWLSVEPDLEKHAVSMLRYMFNAAPIALDLYTCSMDEDSRMSFSDHSVILPDLFNSWMLLYREVFSIPKAMLLAVRVYSPIPCVLHVINNDTGEEVPQIFHRVEPHVYTPNKNGYTFLAEGHRGDVALPGGRWRMRLIGSCEPLPQPIREMALSNFGIKELKDYFIPYDKNIVCRSSVRVSADVVCSVQFQTSNPKVNFQLTILDHNCPVASSTGKGHTLIPLFTFRADPENQKEENVEQPGKDTQPSPCTHKYLLQVEVLNGSWVVSEADATFFQTLRDAEKKKIIVGGSKQEEVVTPNITEKSSREKQRCATPKISKTKDKDKAASKSGQTTEALDVNKPHWILRVVCEQADSECVSVSRDTERQEKIRAEKLAWENAEPGRAAKALQSRLQFINKHSRGLTRDGPADGAETRETESSELPVSPSDNELHNSLHITLDYTPFIRHYRTHVHLKDDWIEEEQRLENLERIQAFRLQRDAVLEHRRQEQLSRKDLIRRQLEQYDNMQVSLSEQRQKILQVRELFRARLIEEVAATEAIQQVELDRTVPQTLPITHKSGNKKK
ncbi:androglobin isoform X3 [Denticeps clupeoides]|uniref:androglobin isoform X3 n=1 Tax=Denticeps clupeoides TaxID=299321 RepID=UPI0010A4F63D|nr:androglobin isoform X3 [Denticeps clupeoides]